MDAKLFSPEMVPRLKSAFYNFLSHVIIDSKETGVSQLEPYNAQRIAIDSIFDGLAEDIHWFVFLKARQLGVTTIMLALDVFWLSMFDGLQGAVIFDTEPNKENFRHLLERLLSSLPRSHSIPVTRHYRDALVMKNGSTLAYLVAGTTKRANSGGLGRSRGLNFIHASECSSWGDEAGLVSLTKSLAKSYPSRLYVFESTARGFHNVFYDIWEESKEDPIKRTVFIGWWAKEEYTWPKGSPIFQRYGMIPPNEEEEEQIAEVKRLYDVDITMEQLAWYRHEKDPGAEPGEKLLEMEDYRLFDQEYPWTEDAAFVLTGAKFFSSKSLSDAMAIAMKRPYKGFRYLMGENFLGTEVEQVRTPKLSHLKVWQEPEEGAIYVIGADPAQASNPDSDFYVAQVLRCYADGVDQVAEFAAPDIRSYQFAWILCHLCGVYRNARLLLELQGGGDAVFVEMKNLIQMLQSGMLRDDAEKMGVRNVFRNVRQYLYHRVDSIGGSYNYHWKTNQQNKKFIYEQFRDAFSQKQLLVNSVQCIEQMRKISREGDEIRGVGAARDDLPMAMALAVHTWMAWERQRLQAQGRTKDAESGRAGHDSFDVNRLFHQQLVQSFFNARARERQLLARESRRRAWRGH